MSEIKSLNLLLYGKSVGTLNFLPGEQTFFAFSQSYIGHPSRPVLSLSFKDRLGNLITDIRPTRGRAPPFFSNMLPEGPLRDYLAARAGVNASREFFLLWVLGRDLPGAVTIEPAEGQSWPPEESGPGRDSSQNEPYRFSLAGVQLKFSAVMETTGGLTIPAEGVGGSWIVKLPSARFEGVPENEYSMMTLARAIGMDIPEIRLVPWDKISGLPDNFGKLQGQALAVRRFDRTSAGRVHMEDFAQVFGIYPDAKYSKGSYKNIAQVLRAECGADAIAEFVRRIVFNTLIGNADMHLKNWSLIYPDRRTARLSPGYDFVSTIPYIADENMALKYARSKRMADLSLEELSVLAAKAGLPEKQVLDTAKETVARFREAWRSEQRHLPLASGVLSAIERNVKTIKLVEEVV